jgi:iron complex outermembrane receptor protein
VAIGIGYSGTTASVTVPGGEVADLEIRLAERATRLSDLVVTAEKAEQNVQDIPAAVSVISGEQIENARLLNTADLSGLIPNVVSTFAATAGVSVVTVRGVNSSTASTFENSVATYVDGVYQADVAAAAFGLGEIERIEILRGPQGTLYGRGAMAGVINVITKGPSPKRRAVVSAEYGNFATQRYRVALAGPLAAEKLFYSVDGLHLRRDGYFYNTYLRRNFDGRRDWAGNARLRFVPSARWSAGLNARTEQNTNLGIFPVAPSDTAVFAHPYQVAFDAENIDRRHVYSGSFDLRYVGTRFAVVSVTGYQRTFRGTGPGGTEADLTPLPLATSTYGQPGFTREGNHNDVWSEELRVRSVPTRDGAIGWALGAYGFRQRNPVFVDIFTDSVISPFRRSYHNLTENHTDVDGYAVFGQANYRPAPGLEFTLGLRYDHQATSLSTQRELRFADGTVNPGRPMAAESPSGSLSPKVSIAYRAGARMLAYATYARGYRAGGANLSGLTTLVPKTYGPENIDNYEVGVKGATGDGRVRANLTGFFIAWRHAQVSSFDLSTFESGTVNSGRVNSKGFEIELSAVPIDRLEVDWNFGYTDARYGRLDLSLDPSRPIDFTGNRPPLVPKVTSTVASVVEVPLPGSKSALVVRGEWRALGTHYFNLANTIRQRGYSLFGASATLRSRSMDLSGWGANLGGKRFIAYGFAFGTPLVMLGAPRTVGLTATFRPWR